MQRFATYLVGVLCLLAVHARAQVNFTLAPTHVTCHGGFNGAIDLTTTSGMPPFTFSWSHGPITEDVSNLTAGLYMVTVTDNNGISATDTVTINEPSAVIVTAGNDVSICDGDFANLSVSASGGTGGYSYSWVCNFQDCNLSANNITNPQANPWQTTIYYAQAYDGNGCASNVDSTIVTVLPLPWIAPMVDDSIFEGASAQLSVFANNAATYLWSPAGSLDNATVFDPVASPTTTTTYTVVVTSADGCVASDSVTVVVLPPPPPDGEEINNLFTPNGDGANDYWTINLNVYRNCDVNIYNRWGTEVYSARGYQNDWDGIYNGEPLPEATYYYVIQCGDGEPITGPITLLRLK